MGYRKSLLVPLSIFANGILLTVILITYTSRAFSSSQKGVVSAGPTIDQVRELADLVVLRLQISDVLKDEASYGNKMAVLVHGDCDLVVDLQRAKMVAVDQKSHTATLELPLPQPTRPRVDHNRTTVYTVERTGLWGLVPFTDSRESLYQEAMTEAQKLVEFASSKPEEAERAKRHAETVITMFFRQFDWDVQVQWEKEKTSSK